MTAAGEVAGALGAASRSTMVDVGLEPLHRTVSGRSPDRGALSGHESPDDQMVYLRVNPRQRRARRFWRRRQGKGTLTLYALGDVHHERGQHEHAVKWFTMGAEAGLPISMSNLGKLLDRGHGVAAPDYPVAAGWYRRAGEAGNGDAAMNFCHM